MWMGHVLFICWWKFGLFLSPSCREWHVHRTFLKDTHVVSSFWPQLCNTGLCALGPPWNLSGFSPPLYKPGGLGQRLSGVSSDPVCWFCGNPHLCSETCHEAPLSDAWGPISRSHGCLPSSRVKPGKDEF